MSKKYKIIQVLTLLNTFINKIAKEKGTDVDLYVHANQKNKLRKIVKDKYEKASEMDGQDFADLLNFFTKGLYTTNQEDRLANKFGNAVTDNTFERLCEMVGVEYDVFFGEGKEDKQTSFSLNQSETITSLFFEAYHNQLKKYDEDLDKYCGTYNFFAIKNIEKGKETEIITQKTIQISKNKNNSFELVESGSYKGIVFKIRECICLCLLKIENQKINDISHALFEVSPYEEEFTFFQVAELGINFQHIPTFRQAILQKIPTEKENDYTPTVYTLENLHSLFIQEKDDNIRLELEKRILGLLWKNSLKHAQINIDYVASVDSFLAKIPNYSRENDFSTNLQNILDNQPIVKVKEEVSITKPLNTKLYKVIILKEHQAIEYEVTEYEEQIDLGIKESQNFCFENVDDILFTSCWSRIDRRGYSCIIYNIDKHSFPKKDIGNMLMVIKKSVALTNYSVRTDFNRKLAKHVKYNSEQIENHKGNYINFFKCKDEKNNEMIGFNIISLDDNLTIKSKTRRNGKDSVYDGWWIPLSDIIEKKHGSSRASPVVEECQYNGVMLYTFHQDQYNEQRVLLGVGHYTLGKRNKDGNIIGCYSGMSIDDNIASGTDVFLKLYKNDILEAKELYPSSESYNFFNKLISDFDTSLLHNDEIKFSLKELLNHYNQI